MTVPDPNASSPQAELAKELAQLRTKGVADPQDRLHRFERLVRIARAVIPGSTDRERVKHLLERGCGELGNVYGPALRVLLGTTADSRDLSVTERHKMAYKVFCQSQQALTDAPVKPIVFISFKTHTEKLMLNELAAQLERIYAQELEHSRAATKKLPNLF